MPYINIRVNTNLTNEQKTDLQLETTKLVHEVMGKKKIVTVVHIDESKAGNWSVNGEPLTPDEPVCAYVDIKITEGTNTTEEKSQMLAKTMKMLKHVLSETQLPCYIVIDDVRGDSWGYDGFSQAARAK